MWEFGHGQNIDMWESGHGQNLDMWESGHGQNLDMWESDHGQNLDMCESGHGHTCDITGQVLCETIMVNFHIPEPQSSHDDLHYVYALSQE